MRIRRARRDDVDAILSLIRALAAYEREPGAVVATAKDLRRDGFGSRPRFSVLLAEERGEPVGFAFYFFTYSTWEGRPTLYLEDLFVLPDRRGQGIGRALMQRLAREAVRAGCTRFAWQVLDWNQPAIDFYGRLGAELLPAWRNVRLAGPALKRLAGTTSPRPSAKAGAGTPGRSRASRAGRAPTRRSARG